MDAKTFAEQLLTELKYEGQQLVNATPTYQVQYDEAILAFQAEVDRIPTGVAIRAYKAWTTMFIIFFPAVLGVDYTLEREEAYWEYVQERK